MVDNDYDGPKTSDIIVLKQDLEDELRNLGWDPQKKRTNIHPDEAYEFISNLIKKPDGKQRIQASKFWEVLRSTLLKTGIDLNQTVA